MILREVLHNKGHLVHTIPAGATLAEVVQKLVRNNCGSLLVCEEGSESGTRMLGIVTERDILKACASHGTEFATLRVMEVMTKDITVGSPTDTLDDTMGLMTEMRIRHLPVVEEGRLLGIVSIGDIVKWQHDQLTMENHYLKSYLQG